MCTKCIKLFYNEEVRLNLVCWGSETCARQILFVLCMSRIFLALCVTLSVCKKDGAWQNIDFDCERLRYDAVIFQ
jgi:hypothetical protein